MAPYLRPGGGGVTCSGGEALLQPQFTAAVFQEAHALGLTTCLDTTGQGTKHNSWDVVLPHTDMVLFCIKVRPAASQLNWQTAAGIELEPALLSRASLVHLHPRLQDVQQLTRA